MAAVPSASQQIPKSDGKATSQVIVQYERLVADGALLTRQGWEKASKLFERPASYPENGTIFLKTTGGLLGQTWIKDNQAEVQTKWTDTLGSIDSALRYKPPDQRTDGTIFIFHLVSNNGSWRIEGNWNARWATPQAALRYVTEKRDRSDSPVLKRNAEKTIRILQRLRSGCGSASAC